ncbi:MAG: hypothetical protein NC517_01395 [Firmicutes bacterium]|nr:hypothetical protein [Bacillota bacterium]
MENNNEYPIIKNGVDTSLENVSATMSLFDTSEVSFDTLYNDFSHQMASLIANGVEMYSTKKFHESLNFWGKVGFVSKERAELFEKKVAFNKGAATAATYIILDVAPSVFGYVANKKNTYNFQKFYISWLAYINKENTLRIEKNVKKLFDHDKIKNYEELFGEFSAENVSIRNLPSLNKSNYIKLTNYEVEQMKIFAGNVLRACDLHDEEVRGRAEEFLDVVCKLSAVDIDRLIIGTKSQEDFLSDFIVFNAITAKDICGSIFNSVKKSEAYAIYNIDNDPYRKIRQKRAILVGEGIKLVGDTVGTLVPKFAPLTAFADMAAEVLAMCVDTPSMETAMRIEEARDKMKGEINRARNEQRE